MSALGWLLIASAVLLIPSRRPVQPSRGGRRADHRALRADRALPLTLDLAAAALRSGRPVAEALVLAAPAAGPGAREALGRVAALLRLGAEPEHAWSALPRDGPLAEVAAAAVRSSRSGTRLAAALESQAADLRRERIAAGAVRAQRAGVHAMGPLAACFLPSFVCLGVIPVVVGMARAVLPALR